MTDSELWKALEGRTVGGKFSLRRWLGSSGHSAAFLTERAPGSRQAAIKLIASDRVKAERQLALWRNVAQLHHPHLIRVYDMGRTQIDSTLFLYLVMEFAEEDLSQIIPDRALSPSEVEDLLPPLLDALSYLHQQGFAHGHIKPSNVHAIDDELKLSVDQLVLLNETDPERKRRDVYDAPEIARGTVSPASDVWSLGATLTAVLTQHAPVYEPNSQKDLQPSNAVTEPFHSIVRDCLRHNPNQRCSLADIEARLRPPARSVAAVEAVSIAKRPSRFTSRVAVAALLAIVLITIALMYSRARNRNVSSTVRQEQPASIPANPSPPVRDESIAQKNEQPVPPPATTAPANTESPPTTSNSAAKSSVSTQGEVVRQVLPTVSRSASATITGKVRVSVRVNVDTAGKVVLEKLVSPGPSKYFASQALKAAQQWEFSPPRSNGKDLPSAWLLHFSFGRSATQVSPERVER
jgi:TonB family protein